MPPVIAGPIALAAFQAGAPLVVANAIVGVGTAGVILHTVVSTAVVVGASYAVARLTAPPLPKPSDGSLEFRQPVPARFFNYGHCKISGPVLFLETNEKNLLKIVAFGTRELDDFENGLYIDGGLSSIPLSAPPAGPGDTADAYLENWTSNGIEHGNVWLHLGSPSQTVNTALSGEYAAWDATHRLRSIPYAFSFLKSGAAADFQGAFPNGEPQLAVVGGVKVYDPRKDSTNGGSGSHRMNNQSTWEFSDNQRLCTLDWLTWPDGYARSWSRIDWATWVPQINMADEDVDLKASSATEKRYRVATKVSYDEPRSRVLHRLLQAGDQQLFYTSAGLIGSRGGTWVDPTVSLDVAGMPEASFTHGVSMMDRTNEFQLSAMLPSHEYTEIDLEPWVNASDPEHIAGIIRRAPLQLTQVPSNGQAQRLAKIYMAKANPLWGGQVRTNFEGLNAVGESAINLSFDELDVSSGDTFNGPFFINGKIAFLPDKTGVTFQVASADPSAYEWDAETEEQDAPALPA